VERVSFVGLSLSLSLLSLSLSLSPSLPPYLGLRAEDDDVHRHVVLFQLLPDLDQGGLVLRDGGANEQDHPLALVLVGPMLEGQLGDLDGGGQVGGAPDGDVLGRERGREGRGG